MTTEIKDDAGSDFGDDLQYDFITPNFESRNRNKPANLTDDNFELSNEPVIKN